MKQNVIFKYELLPNAQLYLPKDAKILSVGVQSGSIMLWALVDSDEMSLEFRNIIILGTGFHIPDEYKDAKFIGTVFMNKGLKQLVWHVFEKE